MLALSYYEVCAFPNRGGANARQRPVPHRPSALAKRESALAGSRSPDSLGPDARCYNRRVPRRCVVGVDVGGTNVRAQAFLSDGEPAGERIQNESQARAGVEPVLHILEKTIRQAIGASESPVEAVGIAFAGHIDDGAGAVRWSPNFGTEEAGGFRIWENVAIREPLSESISVPIHMGNDANLAALGEYLFGTGKGTAKCLVMLTVGTGIGGGVVLTPDSLLGDARGPLVLVGGNLGGAELGHTAILHGGLDSSAGAYGSIEAYCQRDSIVRRAVYKLQRGQDSVLKETVGGDFSKITPRLLFDAAERGDELAVEVWSEVGTYLGVGIGNMINVFAPDVFAIGGQIAKAGKWLLEPAIKSARGVAIPSLFRDARIVQAELIEDAGILGGAALALEAGRWV